MNSVTLTRKPAFLNAALILEGKQVFVVFPMHDYISLSGVERYVIDTAARLRWRIRGVGYGRVYDLPVFFRVCDLLRQVESDPDYVIFATWCEWDTSTAQPLIDDATFRPGRDDAMSRPGRYNYGEDSVQW